MKKVKKRQKDLTGVGFGSMLQDGNYVEFPSGRTTMGIGLLNTAGMAKSGLGLINLLNKKGGKQ